MRVSARVRERTRLERQLGDTEGEVVAREGGEVEIPAEHVKRPVQGKGVGQGYAELWAGSRQIGASDLYLSRRLDRPPKERLRLPVGARDGPDRRQAPVARGDAAFGFRARADLRPIARDEVTTFCPIKIEEHPYGGPPLPTHPTPHHRPP